MRVPKGIREPLLRAAQKLYKLYGHAIIVKTK